ncbi:hypothetical protein KUM42_06305 [Modestobacter sp. L9-4]|nr:hypothetical protein KUM42_06305 [Modestobacter sp. L9-4]
MGLVAWALLVLGPAPAELRAALSDPQGLVDTAGADALVVVGVGALAWLCWAWGALGLLLTAASTVPGWAGQVAAVLLRGVLPAGARRAAALAIGVGLSAVGPTVLPAVLSPSIAVATASETAPGVRLDWPATAPAADADAAAATGQSTPAAGPPAPAAGQSGPAAGPPTAPAADLDWPALAAGEHVVVRGDCLWDIAEAWLAEQHPGTAVPAPEVARAVHAWWQANTDVLGADPDLLLPGQVLRPPV